MSLDDVLATLDRILANPDRAEAFMQFVALYISANDDVRRFIIDSWDFGVSWKYGDLTRLACSVGERWSCRQRIEASLVYRAIASNALTDPRDDLVAIAVVYHSCLAAGLDPNEEFRRVADVSPEAVRTMLLNFINRERALRSCAALELVHQRTSDGETRVLELD